MYIFFTLKFILFSLFLNLRIFASLHSPTQMEYVCISIFSHLLTKHKNECCTKIATCLVSCFFYLRIGSCGAISFLQLIQIFSAFPKEHLQEHLFVFSSHLKELANYIFTKLAQLLHEKKIKNKKLLHIWQYGCQLSQQIHERITWNAKYFERFSISEISNTFGGQISSPAFPNV